MAVTKYRKHRFDPYVDTIIDMIGMGSTLSKICDFLSTKDINADESELSIYIRRRGIRTQVTRGFHSDKAPICRKCANYTEVGTKYIHDRNTNVRVCKACLEVIPQNTQTSPCFCPLRKGGDSL